MRSEKYARERIRERVQKAGNRADERENGFVLREEG